MSVSYNYGEKIKAFYDTHYKDKWGWVWTFMQSKGADLSSAALIRANTHGFVYQTKWASWPYSADYAGVKFTDFESLIPEQGSSIGVDKYEVGQTIEIPEPVRRLYFVAWLLNGEVFEEYKKHGDLYLLLNGKRLWRQDVVEIGPNEDVKTLVEALALAQEGTIVACTWRI